MAYLYSMVSELFEQRRNCSCISIIGASYRYDILQESQADSTAEMASKSAQKALKIGWIGAGSINFGSLEGPWNHAARLQKQNGVQFTAIVEPNLDLARVRRNGARKACLCLLSVVCLSLLAKLL